MHTIAAQDRAKRLLEGIEQMMAMSRVGGN
jgi:hypothetical protein